ncbi:hypothetical protein JYU34_019847 [Plutella xylostella]|uniref:Uncharacterized protein n=1 Tax=Plutella xylostella TaxID=51655 RepID=A0ABQ7PWS4_PLUXY|nr:hypothetical protein JYU34_019847 [Plutella xylostella]
MHMSSPHNTKYAKTYNIIGHSYECLHNEKNNCKCEKLEFVNNFKYLGLTIDRNMSWRTHIKIVCNKLRYLLTKFYHLKHVLDSKTMYSVYYALVESLIDYGLTSYGRTFKSYLDEIKNLQVRFLKLLVNNKTKERYRGDFNALFSHCKILPVHEKAQCLIAAQYYNDYKHKIITPDKNCRRIKKLFYESYKHTNYYGQRTSKYLAPKIYNKLPLEFFNCNNSQLFKTKVKKHLLNQMSMT